MKLLRVRRNGEFADWIRAYKRAGRFRRQRTNVDQMPSLGEQMRHRGARATHQRKEIQIQQLLKLFRRGVNGHATRRTAGVVR